MPPEALRREAEWQDQALSSEKALEQRLHEKQRAVELQSSIVRTPMITTCHQVGVGHRG